STGTSCGAMLSASPVSIRIEPHSSRIIRLGVQTSALPTKECWDIFFVEEVAQRSAVKGNSLQYIFRTGVKVYVAPPGLARDGAVENMAVEDVPVKQPAASTTLATSTATAPQRTKRQIAITFHNTGGMHVLAK